MKNQPSSNRKHRWAAALTRRTALVGSVALLLATLLLATSCSDLSTSPTGNAGDELAPLAAAPLPQAQVDGPEWTVVKTLSFKGGDMLLDGSSLLCNFPLGALLLPRTITAQMRLNGPRGEATRIEMDFQPSMTFRTPVLLIMSPTYLAGNSNRCTLWYFDPDLEKWVKKAEQPILLNLPVVFLVDHFSGYAISR
jgi:hypothetical protein